MEFKDIAKQVINAAPALGAALAPFTGGASAGVGIAVKALGSVFGLGEDATPEKIAQAIAADPDAHLKLVVAEQNYKLECKRMEGEAENARLADVQSARQADTEKTKVTGSRDINLYALAWMVVILFYVLVGMMIFRVVPDANLGPVNQLFGAMAAGFGMVLQFFFGSSKSSADKNEMLARQGRG